MRIEGESRGIGAAGWPVGSAGPMATVTQRQPPSVECLQEEGLGLAQLARLAQQLAHVVDHHGTATLLHRKLLELGHILEQGHPRCQEKYRI